MNDKNIVNDSADAESLKVDSIVAVRSRPVGYRETRFGGELIAVRRGHFPVSSTGYRSLAGNTGAVSPQGLEDLAKKYDEENLSIIREGKKLLAKKYSAPTADHALGNFIQITSPAVRAFQNGFFATDKIRGELWQLAYAIHDKIESDPNCQPQPTGRWNLASCYKRLAEIRLVKSWLAKLLIGDFEIEDTARTPQYWVLSAYMRLPARDDREPVFGLPEIASDFAFATSIAAGDDDDDEDQDEPAESDELLDIEDDDLPDEADEEDPSDVDEPATISSDEQMSLF